MVQEKTGFKIQEDKETTRKTQEHDYIILADFVLGFLSYKWFTAFMHFNVCVLFGMFLSAAGTLSTRKELIKKNKPKGN